MRAAATAARNIGVMQQAALAGCIIVKDLHATEQHFACGPKLRRALRSVAYSPRGEHYARHFFMKLIFDYTHYLHL